MSLLDLADIGCESFRFWRERLPLRGEFRIARGSKSFADVIVVEVICGGVVGYGESVPYARYGESVDGCLSLLSSLLPLSLPLTRVDLQSLLPAGAARNALDCALWDMQARLAGEDLFALGGIGLVETAYTLSVDSVSGVIDEALRHGDKSIFKVKLCGDGDDSARILGLRDARSDCRILVDANESWDVSMYESMVGVLSDAGVSLLEQPFSSGSDIVLRDLPRMVSVCADESCLTVGDLSGLVGLYDVVNIKLDKSGGLTHALEMRECALSLGFGVMVGCMMSSSLSMMYGMLLCCGGVDWVDLDGVLWMDGGFSGSINRSDVLEVDGSILSFGRLPELV